MKTAPAPTTAMTAPAASATAIHLPTFCGCREAGSSVAACCIGVKRCVFDTLATATSFGPSDRGGVLPGVRPRFICPPDGPDSGASGPPSSRRAASICSTSASDVGVRSTISLARSWRTIGSMAGVSCTFGALLAIVGMGAVTCMPRSATLLSAS